MLIHILACLLVTSLPFTCGREPFYIIAHMTNTPDAVDWAVAKGANAIEIDLEFRPNGVPFRFIHSPNGEACDCSCMCPLGASCNMFYPGSICTVLSNAKNKKLTPCSAYTNAETLLHHVAKKEHLALVFIDSKISKTMRTSTMHVAAAQVLMMLERELFEQGYKGKVLIGASYLETIEYFKRVAELAAKSPYRKRITFAMDTLNNEIEKVLKSTILPVNRRLSYGTGLTACAPNPITWETYKLTLINKLRGVVTTTYTWSLDKTSSLETASRYFDGIITNYPDTLYDIIQKEGIPLAKPGGEIPLATSDVVVGSTNGYECDCQWSKGGCTLHTAPPKGFGCKCYYKGGWTCGGYITYCEHTESPYCRNPDLSIHTCIQGGGNCGGYQKHDCDCQYFPGGCKVTKPAYPGHACHCTYQGAWTCEGWTTVCKDPSSRHCIKPDTSAESCIQGGGDCSGYDVCDCDYFSGGCVISKPARPNSACRCTYKGGWTCGGQMVSCVNKDAHHCRSPDKSIQSCVEGNGDCGAYKDHCECSYRKGGCIITKPPASGTACKCKYVGGWTCSSDQVPCRRYHNKYCQNPDTSRATCTFGGGECGGY